MKQQAEIIEVLQRVEKRKQEANAIYYGIMATASKYTLPFNSAKRAEAATDKFLAGRLYRTHHQ